MAGGMRPAIARYLAFNADMAKLPLNPALQSAGKLGDGPFGNVGGEEIGHGANIAGESRVGEGGCSDVGSVLV